MKDTNRAAAGTADHGTAAPRLPDPPAAIPAGPWYDRSLGRLVEGTVDVEGWLAAQRVPGFFDLQRDPGSPDVIAVQLARVEAVARSRDRWLERPSAAAAARALLGHVELLPRTAPTGTAVGGRPAVEIELDAIPATSEGGGFVPVVRVAAGPISVGPGRRLRVIFLADEAEGREPLAVLVGGSIARWADAVAASAPLLAALRIGPPG